jgi:hypothetical protein
MEISGNLSLLLACLLLVFLNVLLMIIYYLKNLQGSMLIKHPPPLLPRHAPVLCRVRGNSGSFQPKAESLVMVLKA